MTDGADYSGIDIPNVPGPRRNAWMARVRDRAWELIVLHGLTLGEAMAVAIRGTPECDTARATALAMGMITGRRISAGTVQVHLTNAKRKGATPQEDPRPLPGEGQENPSTVNAREREDRRWGLRYVPPSPEDAEGVYAAAWNLVDVLTAGMLEDGTRFEPLSELEAWAAALTVCYPDVGGRATGAAFLAHHASLQTNRHVSADAFRDALKRAVYRKGIDLSDRRWRALLDAEPPAPTLTAEPIAGASLASYEAWSGGGSGHLGRGPSPPPPFRRSRNPFPSFLRPLSTPFRGTVTNSTRYKKLFVSFISPYTVENFKFGVFQSSFSCILSHIELLLYNNILQYNTNTIYIKK